MGINPGWDFGGGEGHKGRSGWGEKRGASKISPWEDNDRRVLIVMVEQKEEVFCPNNENGK